MSGSMKAEMLEMIGADDWRVDSRGNLRCPCERIVEDDGSCPNGHTSPLREAGMI